MRCNSSELSSEPKRTPNPECKCSHNLCDSVAKIFAICGRVCDTIIPRGNPHVRAASLLDCVHGVYFRPLVPRHRWILTRRHDHRSIARSRNRVWPRRDVRQSTYAQARLSAVCSLPFHCTVRSTQPEASLRGIRTNILTASETN